MLTYGRRDGGRGLDRLRRTPVLRDHFLGARARPFGRNELREAGDVRGADDLGGLRERPAVLEEVAGGEELDDLAEPEQRLAPFAIRGREHADLHVVADQALVGVARVVRQRRDARQDLVALVREFGGRSAPVGEFVGEGDERRFHSAPEIAVNVSDC